MQIWVSEYGLLSQPLLWAGRWKPDLGNAYLYCNIVWTGFHAIGLGTVKVRLRIQRDINKFPLQVSGTGLIWRWTEFETRLKLQQNDGE